MSLLKKVVHRGKEVVANSTLQSAASHQAFNAVSQLQLRLTYQNLLESGKNLPRLSDVGFRAFSQADEDGILLYIFSIIGTETKKSVEICAGDGMECNTANLIINHGWHGLLVDGDEELVSKGVDYYKRNPNTRLHPPIFSKTWLTRENVNQVLIENGFSGNIELLSIDMDGVDYWIWEAINCIEPRVVVVEYQDILGPDRACTVPYSDSFNASEYPMTLDMPNFCGASLPAFVKLAKSRGYRLVGCNRYGFNAFFIKDPFGAKEIPEVNVGDCFVHPKVLWGMEERFPIVKDFPWVEV